MEQHGRGLYFEELKVGDRFSTGGRTMMEADLVNFCNSIGMTGEVFLNVEFQKTRSALPGRPVPGLMALGFCEALAAQGPTRGNGMALLNLSIDFQGPVFIGDTVHCEIEILEMRESKGRKDAGLVNFLQKVVKQDGKTAVSYKALRLIRRRPAA